MTASVSPRRNFFFVHVMKTGGSTFRQHIHANFKGDAVWPRRQSEETVESWRIPRLLGLPPERRAQVRVYMGHFPFVVAGLLDPTLVTLSILRDPVERIVSYLRQCQREHEHHRDLALEQIYDDEFYFKCFILNHQCKIFAMTAQDRLDSYMDDIAIDEARFATACANLERVDVLGLTERHDDFLGTLRTRFGWTIRELARRRVAPGPASVPAGLRARIVADNAADIAFYEHARELLARRGHRG